MIATLIVWALTFVVAAAFFGPVGMIVMLIACTLLFVAAAFIGARFWGTSR
jgi:hypothetical protein